MSDAELHRRADDGTARRAGAEVRVIVAAADLAALPGDNEGGHGLHGTSVPVAVSLR